MIANDLRLRESETTLAELLGKEGYRTGFIGKWHLDGGKRLPGFVPPGRRRQGMERKLSEWMRRTGDSWSFNSMQPVEDKGRLYRFEAFYTFDEYP